MNPKEKLFQLQKDAYEHHYMYPYRFQKEVKDSRNQTQEWLLENYEKILRPKEFKEIKSQIEKSRSDGKIEIPTPYQDPESYRQLQELSSIVEGGFSTSQFIEKQTGKKVMHKDLGLNFVRPTLGTIFFGSINAYTYPCDDSKYLIVFEMELSTFCYLLSKIIAEAFPVYDPKITNFDYYIEQINKKINENPNIEKHFEELIIAFITTGGATRAPPYIQSPHLSNFVTHLTLAMETFVVAHEYSHILLGHVDKLRFKKSRPNNLQEIMFSWSDESSADGLAIPLVIEGLRNMGYEYEYVSYCGAESYFSGFEICERAKCLVKTGRDEFYWKEGCCENGALGLHPPSHTRRESLRNQMKEIYGEKFLEVSKIVETIIQNLWRKIKPNLIKNRHDLYIKLLSSEVEFCAIRKKYSVALEKLDEILELEKNHLPALFGKGNILKDLKRFKESNSYYDLILEIDKNNLGAIFQKANNAFLEEDYEKAISLSNLGLKIEPKNQFLLYEKGMALDYTERFDEAIECFESILKQDPKNIPSLLRVAFLYSMKMEPETAIEYYDKVLQIDSKHPNALEQKMMLLDYLKKYDDILEIINNFLKETPDDQELLEIKKEVEEERDKNSKT